jgi:hypothetical protein
MQPRGWRAASVNATRRLSNAHSNPVTPTKNKGN